MAFFRNILKLILSSLSRWAISKHDMEVIAVIGYSGTEIVREGIYELLDDKFNVRRNTKRISWDLGLPLQILGHEDKQRNPISWLVLISKTFLYLLLGPRNKHTLILGADSSVKQTAKFWSKIIHPDYLVVLNDNEDSHIAEELSASLKSPKSVLIVDSDNLEKAKFKDLNLERIFTFSQSQESDISYNNSTSEISHNNQVIVIPDMVPVFTYPLMAAVVSLGVNYGISLEEIAVELLKFDMGKILVQRITNKVEE